MRKALVFFRDILAGNIWENEDGYFFQYDEEYLKNDKKEPISLTLPLQKEPYKSSILFPFFDELIPEGWLLEIAVTNWKLNPRDRFGLLLTMCNDCIGCVSVKPENKEKQ